MKKVLLLLLTVLALVSCSLDNDLPDYHYEVLAVESFTVPQSFTTGNSYEIKVKYKRPTDCHYMDGIYYDKEGNTRIIAVQSKVIEKSDCAPLTDQIYEVSFDFICSGGTSYIFKFYKGEDEDGNNIFEEVEIPVFY